jgi:hypothetical protein
MERMMKVQDVLLKAMAKKLSWWAAAEIVGVTTGASVGGGSGCRRLLGTSRRKGQPRAKRVPLAVAEGVLRF